MAYKIRVNVGGEHLVFTTKEYEIKDGLIYFFDRDNTKRIFSTAPGILVSIEEYRGGSFR